MANNDDEVFFTVVYGEKFVSLIETLVMSLMLFSTRKIIVFAGDCRIPFSYPNLKVVYFKTNKDIKDRKSLKGYPLLASFHKFEKTLEMLEKNYSKMFFIDADSFVSKYIDNIWNEDTEEIDYPLLGKHIYEYQILWRRENNKGENDSLGKMVLYDDYAYHKDIEKKHGFIDVNNVHETRPYELPLMQKMGVKERSDIWYGSGGFYLLDKKSKPFFEQCMECLQRVLGEFKNTPKYQHSDEAIMNIMLWKHHASRNLKPTPIWYDLKLQGRESFSNLKKLIRNPEDFAGQTNGGRFLNESPEWGYVPNNLKDILVFHGCLDGQMANDHFHEYLQDIIMTI